MNTKLYYGACLYPELWSDDVMVEDYDHMKKIGMNLARIGEFTWSTLEPEPDAFDFSVIKKSLDLTRERGIDVIICTPTPTPPIWMTHEHPERLHVDEKGQKMIHGSRQHICTNQTYFRERANLLVGKLMEVVKDYDHVIAIQLDNEFKCHVGQCFCSNCRSLWHQWLEDKYETIENLNQAWGTKIWSQEYRVFDQVVQPLKTPFLHNSSLQLNYKRFHHEMLRDFINEQVDVIKEYKDLPVTHNTSMFFDVDNELMGRELDFMSFDTYTPVEHYENFVLNQERWRYIRNDTRRTMLLETSTSYNGHIENYGLLHNDGYVEAESFAAFASGTSSFMYWPFRGQRSGCEQPHGSVVSSWGDKTRGYQSVLDVSDMINKIKPSIDTSEVIEPKVAITYSDRARSFIDIENGGVYNYKELMNQFHKHFLDLDIHRKLVPENHDLSEVDVLFSPYMHHLSEEYIAEAISFVEKGGTWIVGPMSGDRTEELTWHTTNGIGALGEILEVKDSMQYYSKEKQTEASIFGISTELNGLNTFVKTDIEFTENYTLDNDYAFFIEKTIGKGKLVYLGAHLEEVAMKKLISRYAGSYATNDLFETDNEIVVFNREKEDSKERQYWIVNFSNEEKSLKLKTSMVNILEDEKLHTGAYTLKPYEYKILAQR